VRLPSPIRRLLEPAERFINPLPLLRGGVLPLRKLVVNGLDVLRCLPTANRPARLQLESSAVCNLRCVMCTYETMKRKRGLLSLDNFKYIYDQVVPPYLDLTGFGEPFMNRDIFEMIRYAKARGSIVKINTNGTVLDNEIRKGIISSGLDFLAISIDSPRKQDYEKIRVNADFDEMVRDTKALVRERRRSRRRRPDIISTMVVTTDNFEQVGEMVKFSADEIGIEPVFQIVHSFDRRELERLGLPGLHAEAASAMEDALALARERGLRRTAGNLQANIAVLRRQRDLSQSPCYMPWFTSYITWDGDLLPCCFFYDAQIKFGNVLEEPFMKIWNGPAYRAFREACRHSRPGNLICRNCDIDFAAAAGLRAAARRLLPFMRIA